MALAYFITFSTYGAWLHGRERGSVDREHNEYGTPFLPADPEQESRERGRMTEPAYVMSAAERDVACRAMVELARERGWRAWAVHVRSNHVHVVIKADRDAERVMSDLKARASRELTRAGFDSTERRRWARHGSTKHLFHEEDIEARVRYTLDQQGERMAWHEEPRTE